MDTRESLVNAINLLRDVLENGEYDASEIEEVTIEFVDDTESQRIDKAIAESNGKHPPLAKEEMRVESDLMDDPPFSQDLVSDLCETCIDVQGMSAQRGRPLECVIIGEFTAVYASELSKVLNGTGGRILCIGDCLDSSGSIKPSWIDLAGSEVGKSIYPVKGDTNENYQGMDKMLDMVVLSTCGKYHEMASLISRWAGLVRQGGVICGTQWDEEMYPASVSAIKEIFGERATMRSDSGFWYIESGK